MENSENQYGIVKSTQVLPIRDLLRVPHKSGINLTVGHPAFGPNTYSDNLTEMQKTYFHSNELPRVSFRPATTAESVSAVAYNFADFAKPQIFDPSLLQAGYILRTEEGVFVNPLDPDGNPITDENILKQLLKADRKVNGIYLLDNDSGFAPYDSFSIGVQDCDNFVKGGLARVLEHTHETEATKLRAIASTEIYKGGVNVLGFYDVKSPLLRVACLGSDRHLSDWLDFYGNAWFSDLGYAFGVLNPTKGSTKK